MKNLLLTFALMITALTINAQSESYYLVEGRQSQLSTVTDLVNNLNQTQYTVYPRANNALGEHFRISYFKNNTFDKNSSKLVHLSDLICANIRKNMDNPQTGQSIGSVCGTQIGIINSVLKLGLDSPTPSIDTRMVENNQTTIIQKIDTLETNISNMEYNNQYRFKVAEENADFRHQQEMNALATISRDVKTTKKLAWVNTGLSLLNLGVNTYGAVRQNKLVNMMRNTRGVTMTGPQLDPSR